MPKQLKKINYDLIDRGDDPKKPNAVYAMLDRLVAAHHDHLAEARRSRTRTVIWSWGSAGR